MASVVLVVEDEPLISLMVEEALQDAGYIVLSARNADFAIAVLASRPDIHLMFTDIDMPGSMDGLKLAAFVRGRYPPMKIVIASGKRRPSFIELPIDAIFLPKPYMMDDVLTAFATFA